MGTFTAMRGPAAAVTDSRFCPTGGGSTVRSLGDGRPGCQLPQYASAILNTSSAFTSPTTTMIAFCGMKYLWKISQ